MDQYYNDRDEMHNRVTRAAGALARDGVYLGALFEDVYCIPRDAFQVDEAGEISLNHVLIVQTVGFMEDCWRDTATLVDPYDDEAYATWVRQWRHNYALVGKTIKGLQTALANVSVFSIETRAHERQMIQSHLDTLSRLASEMLAVRKVAKLAKRQVELQRNHSDLI